MSFLAAASKRVDDVRGFLRDAAGGNSIKYTAEKGARHLIYIPYKEKVVMGENGEATKQKALEALIGKVHEWTGVDGKYKAVICMKDVIRKSEDGTSLLNDGTCPFCDRVSDAWDIYRYRKELEEEKCKLTGDERKKHLEKVTSTFADERKAKDARTYMYLLVVKFRISENGSPVLGSDNLPEYDLKVMKLSSSRVEKIQQQIANAGADLPGSELIFEYPSTDDKRLQISQSTTSPVFPDRQLLVRYPGLRDKIDKDVAKFDWEGIDKSFSEWSGMTTEAALATTNGLFEKWDEYKKAVAINPSAQYMEYITDTPVSQPALAGATAPMQTPNIAGAIPAPVIGGMGGEEIKMPQPPTFDANAVFGGQAGVGAPKITI